MILELPGKITSLVLAFSFHAKKCEDLGAFSQGQFLGGRVGGRVPKESAVGSAHG